MGSIEDGYVPQWKSSEPANEAPGLAAGMRNVANDEAYHIMQAERCRAVPQEELERRMREQVPMMLNAYRPVLPEEPPKAPPSAWARICRWLGI